MYVQCIYSICTYMYIYLFWSVCVGGGGEPYPVSLSPCLLLTGARDKDSEVRDDPTKYYLLDPATIAMNTPSPKWVHHIVSL